MTKADFFCYNVFDLNALETGPGCGPTRMQRAVVWCKAVPGAAANLPASSVPNRFCLVRIAGPAAVTLPADVSVRTEWLPCSAAIKSGTAE